MRSGTSHTERDTCAEVIPLYERLPEKRSSGRRVTPAPGRAGSRRIGRLLIVFGVCLVPWLILIAIELPASSAAAHWRVTWAGIDALEAGGLITLGTLLVRGHRPHAVLASATATLLMMDAWLDITTASGGGELSAALVLALCAELPVAALCARLAIQEQRRWS